MILKHIALTLAIILAFPAAIAQQNNQTETLPNLQNGTVNEQFEYILKTSNRYQDFKVVKKTMLNTLQANTNDSITGLKTNIKTLSKTISDKQNQINTLQQKLTDVELELQQVSGQKDSMSLLGISMSKVGYNTLLWSIIIILIGLLAVFVYKFKNSNLLTKKAKVKLADVEQEFEDHRRVALEREQKVRRQLQDEINKNKAK